MADKMEIDNPKTPGTAGGSGDDPTTQQEKILRIHPLAIINISDHHTRVVTGGSALAPESSVVGLLFGTQDGLTISIVDAEDMEPFEGLLSGPGQRNAQQKERIKTRIELHRKVFPSHEVMGWYRVGQSAPDADPDDFGPTATDLRLHNGPMREYNESPIFLLMNSTPASASAKSSNAAAAREEETSKKMRAVDEAELPIPLEDTVDLDEHLPLTAYESLITMGSKAGEKKSSSSGSAPRAVFVNLEFELATVESERIAIEHVLGSQPSRAGTAATNAAAASASKPPAEDPTGVTGMQVDGIDGLGDPRGPKSAADVAPVELPPSDLQLHLESLRSSILAMNARVAVLLDFLRRTEAGEIPPNFPLLRQVDGIVRQLPFVTNSGSFGGRACVTREVGREQKEMMDLSYLATVAKTARSVQIYTDKFQLVHENSGTAPGPGSQRGPPGGAVARLS